MTRRVARVVAISTAVVIVAVLSLYVLPAERRGPAPSALPTPTATPAAAASPSPTTAAADRFGYVFFMAGFNENSEQRIVVRRERDAAPVFELAGIGPAVSADGKRLAYWRTTPNTGDANGPNTIPTDLRVLDVANPTSDRSVLTLSDQSLGGEVVWSNDGQGLLVVTYSRARTRSEGPESCPLESAFLMLDLATTPPATRSAGSGACSLHPLAWDRPGQVAAAIANGPGGYANEYVTWNGNAASPFARAPVPNEPGDARTRTLLIAGWVQASADAKLVMGLESSGNVLRVWPILDITRAEYLRQPSTISPVWRPGATAPYEMIWGVGQRLDLVAYQGATATTLYTSSGNAGPVAVRPDGSGVLLTEFSPQGATPRPPPPPTTATRLVFVDVATRRATDVVSPLTNGVKLLSRGVLLR